MVISNRVGKWISHLLSAQTILLHTHVKRSNDRTGRKNFRSSETELRFQETISHCNSLMFTIEIHSDFRSDISQKLAGESFSKFQELFTVGTRQGIEALIGSNPISGSRDVVSTSESMWAGLRKPQPKQRLQLCFLSLSMISLLRSLRTCRDKFALQH